ncbi:MAG TPA: CBS domain-containing protein [Anaerolineales bacterium]|nr:CBS domain-containing protein [Anaerolineales bacterium]
MSAKIKDIMSRDVEIVHPDDTLQQAAMKMRSRDVGFLPVCDGERLVGGLSDRDITIRATAEGKDPKKARVKDFAQMQVAWCFADQSVDDAAKRMQDKEVRRIMVIDRDTRRLVGVVSLGDVATKDSSKRSGKVLEDVGPK